MDAPRIPWPYQWVDTVADLASVAEQMAAESYVAVDTETAGWESGNERLCLVQVGLPQRQHVYVIDVLALESLEPLREVLRSPRPLLIAHNAGFEERQFSRIGMQVGGLVDTLAMARRLRPDLPSHSLQSCCRFILNISISKEEQRSNWARRPLSQNQIEYAASDAEVTVKLYEALIAIEKAAFVDPAAGVKDLMQELTETVRTRMELMRPFAMRVAELQAREDALREAMRKRLSAGEPPYEGPLGHSRISHSREFAVDPRKLREAFPELADYAIEESVNQTKLEALLRERGIPVSSIDALLTEVAARPRLSIVLKSLLES